MTVSNPPVSPDDAPLDWDAAFSTRARGMTASTIREFLKLMQRPGLISFAGGLPAAQLFPVEAVKLAAGQALERYGPSALQYATTEGHLPLREWIAARGGLTPDHVQIVSGSQQGLDLLGKVLISQGDVVLVEAPTYLGALQSFQPYGPRYVQMPSDDDGIDVDALEALLNVSPAKVMYTIPNFQNPTGRTLSLERRQRLALLTARHGVVVIEDDPYGELRFSGEVLPSLYQLALARVGSPDLSNVVYCSSFSKTLAPGLRVAWVQGARPLIGKLVQAKQGADLHTPILTQMIVTELLPELPAQVERVRALYQERAGQMLGAIHAHFPAGVQTTRPQGGMFLWVTLPAGLNAAELLVPAVERGVAFVPGAPFFALGGGEATLRLSYSSASAEQIQVGIGALGEVLSEGLAAGG